MSISSNIKQLQASIPEGVTLVAVSKFHPVEALQEAYAAGQRVFGENKAQELLLKQEVIAIVYFLLISLMVASLLWIA